LAVPVWVLGYRAGSGRSQGQTVDVSQSACHDEQVPGRRARDHVAEERSNKALQQTAPRAPSLRARLWACFLGARLLSAGVARIDRQVRRGAFLRGPGMRKRVSGGEAGQPVLSEPCCAGARATCIAQMAPGFHQGPSSRMTGIMDSRGAARLMPDRPTSLEFSDGGALLSRRCRSGSGSGAVGFSALLSDGGFREY
jgi:hypothetical protein